MSAPCASYCDTAIASSLDRGVTDYTANLLNDQPKERTNIVCSSTAILARHSAASRDVSIASAADAIDGARIIPALQRNKSSMIVVN